MPTVTREFQFDRTIERTWDFMVTPETVAPCVPGCQSFSEVEDDVFDAALAVKVAYTDLTFDTRVEITDKDRPNQAVVRGEGHPTGRIPGSATVDGRLELSATDDGGTSGTIDIEFAIRGRLGSLGEGAFRHKCEQLTDEFLANVAARLDGEDTG